MTREVSLARDRWPTVPQARGMTWFGEVTMHKYRITFLSGLAVGFVLGARAGRERYEQIKRLSRQVTDSPAAQQAAGAVQAQAAGLAKAAKQKVTDQVQSRVPKLAGTAGDKVGGYVPGLKKNGMPDGSASNGSGHPGTAKAADGHPFRTN